MSRHASKMHQASRVFAPCCVTSLLSPQVGIHLGVQGGGSLTEAGLAGPDKGSLISKRNNSVANSMVTFGLFIITVVSIKNQCPCGSWASCREMALGKPEPGMFFLSALVLSNCLTHACSLDGCSFGQKLLAFPSGGSLGSIFKLIQF